MPITSNHLSVLVITEHFPSRIQPWVVNDLEIAVRRGAELTIVADHKQGEGYPQRVLDLGLLERTEYCRLDGAGLVVNGLSRHLNFRSEQGRRARRGLGVLLRSKGWHPRTYKERVKAMARSQLLGGRSYQLIHSHYLVGAYEYLFIAEALGIPLITKFHGLGPVSAPNRLPDEKAETLFARGEIFIVNSQFARRQLEELGCPATKIRVLPVATRIEEFPFTPHVYPQTGEPLRLLTVGRLSPEKGHRYMIEAVRDLTARGLNIEYRIVGHGPFRPTLEEEILALGLKNKVTLAGELDDDSLHREYAAAHIFILPSTNDGKGYHVETQGAVMQEAQASGSIVVATRTGGIPEFLDDGHAGFLVPQRNPRALADKIEWLARRPEQWETWQRAGRAWVEKKFTMQVIGDSLWQIYRESLQGTAASQRKGGD